MNASSQPLLSVCTPTYNRVNMLRVTLDSIFNQFEDESLKNLVEVVVSDNASPDSTQNLVAEYQKKFSQLKYFRNPENLGADLNIVNSVVKATGKYGWYLGDDDALPPGALKYACGVLEKFSPAVMGIKPAVFTDPTRVPGPEFTLKEKDPIVIEDFQEFMAKGYCLGILGVLAFDRDLWMATDRTNSHSLWECVEILLRLMPKARNRKFVYIDQVGVLAGEGYGWVRGGKELYTFMDWREILNSLPGYGYDKAWVLEEDKKLPGRLPLILLRAKGHGLSMEFRHLRNMYKSFSGHWFYLSLATIIFFVPNFIVRFVRDLRKRVAPKKS